MAALEYVTNNEAKSEDENRVSTLTTRQKVASVLFGIPEPAAQTAALQLLKSKVAFDKSFALCLGLIGVTVLEEMI